ncbi:MAG: hypothetical protein KC649_06065 [Candidatus Omnitrophica bacterium]|nr:hypothetical protein [Candidatus Omnitrophota bacterium]
MNNKKNKPYFYTAMLAAAFFISGCGAYNFPDTPVKEFDFSHIKNNASRQELISVYGQPGHTETTEEGLIKDEWLLSVHNHPDDPDIQKALHIASAGMFNVLDHPTKTGVNRKSLKLVTAIFNTDEKLQEVYLEDTCYWGCT